MHTRSVWTAQPSYLQCQEQHSHSIVMSHELEQPHHPENTQSSQNMDAIKPNGALFVLIHGVDDDNDNHSWNGGEQVNYIVDTPGKKHLLD